MVEDTRLKKLQSYSDAVDKINENKYEKNNLIVLFDSHK